MLTTTDFLFVLIIILVFVGLAVVISLGNERVRWATLELRDVARNYALADLQMRRDGLVRDIRFDSKDKAMAAILQILLDVLGNQPELSEINLEPGPVVAIVCLEMSGRQRILPPAKAAYLELYPAKKDLITCEYAVNGLGAGEFVVAELEAVAHCLGAQAMPRTQEWTLLVLAASRVEAAQARRSSLRLFSRLTRTSPTVG